MAMEFKKKLALLSGTVGVEDAEVLLEWLQGKPHARVDLSACEHLHPANIQVLLAAKPEISAWPKDADLRSWLQSVIH
jgi:hypothetical protein